MRQSIIPSQTVEKKKTVNCAIYTRKSTDENLHGDFTSLDSQAEYCRSFIKSREPEGWRAFEEAYNDPGFSGGNMDRPALKKLIADAKLGKFQVVVCYKYDRLSRNTKDFLHILDIFDRHGVAFVSVTQPIDTTSSIGRLMRSILMDFAQFEREMISERTRDKISAMARKGKWFGGRPILGFDIDPDTKKLLPNPEESKQVQEMFETYLRTSSLSQTVKILDEKGIRMKRWLAKSGVEKGGYKLHKVKLDSLLRNPVYIGFIRHNGSRYKGEHEAIIHEKLFNDVGDLLGRNVNGQYKRPNNDAERHHFLLRGLVKCTHCNYAMTPNFAYSKGNKFFYYKCMSVVRLDKSACKVRSVPAKALEQFVLRRMEQLSQNQVLVNRLVAEAQSHSTNELPGKIEERRFITAQFGRIQDQEDNIGKILAMEGPNSKRYEYLMRQIDALQEQKESANSKLKALEKEIIELESRKVDADVMRRNFESFGRLFEKIKPKELAELMRLLIQSVDFDGVGSRVKIVYRALPEINFENGLDEASFDYRKDRLPDPYGKHTLMIRLRNEAETVDNKPFLFFYEARFMRVRVAKGRIRIVILEEGKAIQSRQRRFKKWFRAGFETIETAVSSVETI